MKQEIKIICLVLIFFIIFSIIISGWFIKNSHQRSLDLCQIYCECGSCHLSSYPTDEMIEECVEECTQEYLK